ncbi:hypothetical protein GCM10010429_58010 [Micromonospora olivasterospora]|uniref:Alkylation response protein AidB-like acyl-CoA dehydrogenase n=2 Tax=Micromonospora olivasterospora TaxID=1880 RepID=A0A562I2R2_MICOL|nr:hypothetical protein JD77_00226 [Micromonospora olivasterospora]
MPTDDEQAIADVVREFARTELRPMASHIEDDPSVLDDALRSFGQIGLVQTLAEAGLTGDELYPRVLSAIVLEELAWADANTAAAFSATTAFVRAVAEFGTDHQRRTVLATYADSSHATAAITATELGLLDDPQSPATALTTTPDGLVLNGTKTLVPLADRCQHFLVTARHNERLVAVIVPADRAGLEIGPTRETMGLTAQRFRDITLRDLPIDPADLLGESDIPALVNSSWTAASAILTGLCRAVHEHSVEYTKMRSAHGSPLARKQTVALRLVDMLIDVESMRWMSWRAATHIDKGIGGARTPRLAHALAVKRSNWIVDEGVQLMGGHGYITENPVEAWYRNAKTTATLSLTVGV